MKKFKRSEEKVVGHLLHCAYNKEITQFILNTIGRENWTKSILSNCTQSVLTEEQRRQCMEMKNIAENIPVLKQQLEQQNLKYIKAVVLDISAGGMKFTSFVQQNVGDSLLLLPELPEELEEKFPILIGSVISSNEILGQEPPMYDNRISFEGVSGTQQEEIISYIFKEEVKKKRQRRI